MIEGVRRLYGCEHRVIPDRIAAATFMSAAAATGGCIRLNQIIPAHLEPVLPSFEELGCCIEMEESSLRISAPARLGRIKSVRTMPYPGFPHRRAGSADGGGLCWIRNKYFCGKHIREPL